MSTLTSLGDRKTPTRPVEITFAPETGLPSDLKELIVIGHRGAGAASGSSGVANYTVVNISNVANADDCETEVESYFGVDSELSKGIVAAVVATQSLGVHPAIKAIALASTDTGFGASDVALTAAKRVKGELLVSPYTGSDATTRGKIKDAAQVMSGPERTENNQFGTFGIVFDRVSAVGALPTPDSQYLQYFWMPDTGTGGNAPTYSILEMACACAARYAANIAPFNPLDNITIDGVPAPALPSDWITVGSGLESETALVAGVSPLRVKPNGEVAFVRTVTTRITIDGTTAAQAYYDGQDFDVLYYFRKAVYTREKQTDFTNVKASKEKAQDLKGEVIRLAQLFETQTMFQAVSKLASQFVVRRSLTDRHAFEVFIPVNVVPGLHNILNNVQAGTQFDSFTV